MRNFVFTRYGLHGGELCPRIRAGRPSGPYRPRHPRATVLYQLVDGHYETVKRVWKERFE